MAAAPTRREPRSTTAAAYRAGIRRAANAAGTKTVQAASVPRGDTHSAAGSLVTVHQRTPASNATRASATAAAAIPDARRVVGSLTLRSCTTCRPAGDESKGPFAFRKV